MISPNNYATIIINVRGGREGANTYPVAMGYTALLLDEESKMFFIKKSDGSPMREFTYEEVSPAPVVASDPSKYATKDDINAIIARLDEIQRAQSDRYSPKFNKPRRNEHDGQRYTKPDVR